SSIGSAHSGSVASGVFLSTRVRGYWYSADIYPVARGPTEHAPGSAPTHRNECVVERGRPGASDGGRSEEHTSELQSRLELVCRLLLENKMTDRQKQRDKERNGVYEGVRCRLGGLQLKSNSM